MELLLSATLLYLAAGLVTALVVQGVINTDGLSRCLGFILRVPMFLASVFAWWAVWAICTVVAFTDFE